MKGLLLSLSFINKFYKIIFPVGAGTSVLGWGVEQAHTLTG